MGYFTQGVVVLSLAIFLGVTADDNSQSNSLCEEGWHFHDGMCYLTHPEYETFQMAVSTCALFGAEIAYATNKNTLSFLQKTIVDKSNSYGFWYGVKVFNSQSLQVFDPDTNRFRQVDDSDVNKPILPPIKPPQTPSTKYVGLSTDDVGSMWMRFFHMMDVSNTTNLPYICRGVANAVKLTDDDNKYHVVRSNTSNDVYWFSSLADKRSYDEAVKSCQSKNMTLLSIGQSDQMTLIVNETLKRQDRHVDPWWIGLQVDKDGVQSWSNGVYLDPPVIKEPSTHFTMYCRIILFDGTIIPRGCVRDKAPVICMREHSLTGKYGCPHKWERGGQSCYMASAMTSYSSQTYQYAEKFCSKADSHVLSVESPLEKLWLTHSRLMSEYSKGVWTSLKYANKDGQYVWANGKAAWPSVLTWTEGDTLHQNSGNCFTLMKRTLFRSTCTGYNYAACQYTAIKGKCVSDKWKYLNGQCYWVGTNNYLYIKPYDGMLHVCYADVLKYDDSIVVSPVSVDNLDVLDLYSENDHRVWVGLQEPHKGVYKWQNGNALKISMFNTNYAVYYGASTGGHADCTVLNRNGNFMHQACDCKCNLIVCEKELAAGGGNSVIASTTVQVLTLACLLSLFIQRI